jgi:hypothetical protein
VIPYYCNTWISEELTDSVSCFLETSEFFLNIIPIWFFRIESVRVLSILARIRSIFEAQLDVVTADIS